MITNLCYADFWWHHLSGHSRDRVTWVGGSSRPNRLKIQPIHQRRQDQINGQRRIACCILIRNEQLGQVNTFPYLGSLITKDGECATEFRTRLIRWQAVGASLQKIWKSHSIPISTKIRLMKALPPVATYGWTVTLRKNEERCLDAFEMRGLRKIQLVSWTAKKANEWVLNKVWVRKELWQAVKAKKLARGNKGIAWRNR